MARVLVVDDSPTLRYLVRTILESDPELQVVGEAGDGEEAIALCRELQPDIVTMDIRMPKMDGYQAIRRIMDESPRPIVVLTSTESDRELGISFKATEVGAISVVGKPQGLPGEDVQAEDLIAEIKAMAGVKVVRRRWSRQDRPAPPQREHVSRTSLEQVRLFAIGASTGGPPALQAVFDRLPADLSVPVVVVQHISSGFVHGLARWLDGTTPLRVRVAESDEQLQPGTVYLAPDDRHLLVAADGRVRLKDSPLVDGHRPSVTALFESVAQNYGSTAIGVLLSGMGGDGARGLRTLYDAGGLTIAQDEATCIIFGMPKEAIGLGAAEEVLPLAEIGPRLAVLAAMRKEER
jgi:two-component system chemotaxis response regulator CheB